MDAELALPLLLKLCEWAHPDCTARLSRDFVDAYQNADHSLLDALELLKFRVPGDCPPLLQQQITRALAVCRAAVEGATTRCVRAAIGSTKSEP